VATKRETTKAVADARPDRVVCLKPQGFWTHGLGSTLWMAHVNGGAYPKGAQYFEVLKDLAARAGVDASILDRELSDDEKARHEERARRGGVLEAVLDLAQEILPTPRGEAARAFLRDEKGLEGEALRGLGLGLYPTADEVRGLFKAEDLEAAEKAGLTWPDLEGRIVIPWRDETGTLMTFCNRWPEKRTPADTKKYLMLPGPGTTAAPLFLDRALKARYRDPVVLVEGALDAAVLQAYGDLRVVAHMGATISAEQVKTLARQKVRSAVVVADPDEAGEQGAARSVEALERVGISAFVAPELPDGLDPDEFVLRDGVDAWKAHVAAAVAGPVFVGTRLLEGITPTSPDMDRRRAVDRVLDLVETLRGPAADLNREDLILRLADATGYSFEVLAEQAESLKDRRRREELERETKKALRDAQAALEKGDAAPKVVDRLGEDLAALRARTVELPPPFSVDRLERETASLPEGRSLGWHALNELEVALHPGELAVLAGRTGHGKTTVMVNLFLNLVRSAADEDTDELFVLYSAEEPELRIYHRLLALMARVDGTSWSANEVRDFIQKRSRPGNYPDPTALDAAREDLRLWEKRVLVVHRPSWTVADLEADARRLKAERNVGAVLVDYLQRIGPPKDFGKGRRRDEEVSAVARRLKALAEDLTAPVVAGAQINRRAVEDAKKVPLDGAYGDLKVMKALEGRRPQLHHLREGGSEQEADLVLGLMSYGADYQEDAEKGPPPPVTKLEVGTLKNRYGPPGRWAALALEGRTGWVRDKRVKEDL
jgi:replicative DNA helicase